MADELEDPIEPEFDLKPGKKILGDDDTDDVLDAVLPPLEDDADELGAEVPSEDDEEGLDFDTADDYDPL